MLREAVQGEFCKQGLKQPVKWRRWSGATLDEAIRKNKLLFVALGAQWAHWCAVMDSETFSDQKFGAMLNHGFIPVRVDRDEHPELDRALQATVGGGWPLNAVVTPDLRVVFGANYITLEDGAGGMGLRSVLLETRRLWMKNKEQLLKNSRELFPKKKGGQPTEGDPIRFDAAMLDNAVVKLLTEFDWDVGGLGSGQKFPHPSVDLLLLAHSYHTGDTLGSQASLITLRQMHAGGIMDQVGGGFHRTSDPNWFIPSFEKLLADNGEILKSYAAHFAWAGDVELLDAVELTGNSILRYFWADGGFGVSLAADSDGIEGGYYTWTPKELSEALRQDLVPLAKEMFGVRPHVLTIAPEAAPHGAQDEEGLVQGRVVLRRILSFESIAARLGTNIEGAWSALSEIRASMEDYRRRNRTPPRLDSNMYTHPNAVAVEGLLLSSQLVPVRIGETWREGLTGLLKRIERNPGRRIGGSGEPLLEDEAATALSLMSAYEVTGEIHFLDSAASIVKSFVDRWFPTVYSDSQLDQLQPGDSVDSPNESPVALATRAIVKLSLLKGERHDVMRILRNVSREVRTKREEYVASIYLVWEFLQREPLRIAVLDSGDGRFRELIRAAHSVYSPLRAITPYTQDSLDGAPPEIRDLARKATASCFYIYSSQKEWTGPYFDSSGAANQIKARANDRVFS
jgi:uncharacterized protein YyaL (SSP411 family)